MAQKLLADMDTDQSGTVSKEEFVAFGEKMSVTGAPSANALETPGQRSAPLSPSSSELFSSTDENADQSLSIDELASMLAQGEARAKATHRPNAESGNGAAGHGGPPPGGGPHAGGMRNATTASADNADSASSTSSSDPADSNKDGVVSAAEQLIYDITHPNAGDFAEASNSSVNVSPSSR